MTGAAPDPTSLPGVASRIGQSLISALPPAFLALLVINAGFLWFESHATNQRVALMDRVLDACMSRVEAQ